MIENLFPINLLDVILKGSSAFLSGTFLQKGPEGKGAAVLARRASSIYIYIYIYIYIPVDSRRHRS